MKNIISRFFNKQKVERAIKTFIESFASYIAVNILVTDITHKSALYALLAGAIASAISMVLNIRLNDNPENN